MQPPDDHDRLRSLVEKHLYGRYQDMQDEVLKRFVAPPHFFGRGIVVCAGGPRLFTCAWVLMQMLRNVLGSHLPVEIWHRGPAEMDEQMLALLTSFDSVTAVDATHVDGYHRIANQHGWTLKPFAILNSRFREVLFIDADNVPVADPARLFDTPEYLETGAIFWPDLFRLSSESRIWEITRVPYRDEPSFETGQLVVDKSRCWEALLMTMHLNEQSDFYYRFLYGDKDTFHFGWRMLDAPYAMPSDRPGRLTMQLDRLWNWYGPVLLQYGFDGSLLFQHRNHPKWAAWGNNPHYPGFLYESECLEFLRQLRSLWNGRVATLELKPERDGKWFRYIAAGCGERLLEFLPNDQIGCGAARDEQLWRIINHRAQPLLEIADGDGVASCRLAEGADGIWSGSRLYNDRSPVQLIPRDYK